MNAIPPSAVVTAFSDARDERLAAGELAAKLRHDHLGCVLFFCSIDYRLDRPAGALAEAGHQHRNGTGAMSHGVDVLLAHDMHGMNADLAEIAGNADKRQRAVLCHDAPVVWPKV